MKDKLKKFVREHQEAVATFLAGFVIALPAIAYHLKKMEEMQGQEVDKIMFLNVKDGEGLYSVTALLKNGKGKEIKLVQD